MKLASTQFAAALGHSASMASGIRAMFGVDTKTLHMGRGAQNGILAARLAAGGFQSCPAAIEAWAKLVSTSIDEQAISTLADTGSYEILENTFKPYPCGIVIHPLIDAALEAHQDFAHIAQDRHSGTISTSHVRGIEATVNPQCTRLCSVRHPKTGLETIFSLYHGIAAAFLYGVAGPEQFSDKGCQDPQVAALRDKITVHEDPNMADDAAKLNVSYSYENEAEGVYKIDHATGSKTRPMSTEQLEEKFMALSSGILGHERASEIMKMCWNLENIPRMADLVGRLIPP